MESLFVLEWLFPEGSEARLAVRPRHRAFLEELQRQGRLVAAGPWADDKGALIVLVGASIEDIESLLETDPYVTEGVGGERHIREWRPFLGGTINPR